MTRRRTCGLVLGPWACDLLTCQEQYCHMRQFVAPMCVLEGGSHPVYLPHSWGLCACALSSFKIFYLHLGLPLGQP